MTKIWTGFIKDHGETSCRALNLKSGKPISLSPGREKCEFNWGVSSYINEIQVNTVREHC